MDVYGTEPYFDIMNIKKTNVYEPTRIRTSIMFLKPVVYETQDFIFELGITTFSGRYFEVHDLVDRDVMRVKSNENNI